MEENEIEPAQNPFLEQIDWDDLTTFGGIKLSEGTKYPFGTTVRRLGPVKGDKQKRMRFQIATPDGEDTDIYTAGDVLDDMLPPEIKDMLDEAVERAKPYYEMYFAAMEAFQKTIQTRELLAQAIAEKVDKVALKAAGYEDFRPVVLNGYMSIMASEMSHIEAKMTWLQQYIEAAYMTVSHNIQSWLGCTLPVGVMSQPQPDRTIKVHVEVAPLDVKPDGTVLDYPLGLDCRWNCALFVGAVFPEFLQDTQFQQTYQRVLTGGSVSGLIV